MTSTAADECQPRERRVCGKRQPVFQLTILKPLRLLVVQCKKMNLVEKQLCDPPIVGHCKIEKPITIMHTKWMQKKNAFVLPRVQ